MSDQSGFSAIYRHGVPWSTLRIEGLGASDDIPEIDFSESSFARNEGCLTLAVAPAEIEVEIKVTTGDPSTDKTVVFAGALMVPNSVLEVGDLVGDDFAHRFRAPAGETNIVVSVDILEEATSVEISAPAVLGELP